MTREEDAHIIIIIFVVVVVTAIFALGGSSPYSSTDKTNKNKYTSLIVVLMHVTSCSLVDRCQHFVAMFSASVTSERVSYTFLFVSPFVCLCIYRCLLSSLLEVTISLHKFEVLQNKV
jgi:uncharacterized membrane protein